MSEQNGTRRNVVIVMYQYSVIVKTIERKLQELRYEVEILAGEFDKIAEKAMLKPLFLVYLPKNFASDIRNISSLNLILDIISKKGAEMILLGEGSDYETLKQLELIPFQAAIDGGADMVMTAHIVFPELETGTYRSIQTGEEIGLPATLSKTILTDILRGDMGFKGLIVTDSLVMDAIKTHFDLLDVAKLM